MKSASSSTILFRNTMRITDGHLDGFRQAIARAVDFTREHGPQLMVEVFVDEDRMLAYSFQLYHDSDAIRAHWKLSDPYIREVMEHCTVQRFEVFGEPDADILAALHTPDGASFPVTVSPRLAGFNRLDSPAPGT
jgi:quinol monooxygenase YgiN